MKRVGNEIARYPDLVEAMERMRGEVAREFRTSRREGFRAWFEEAKAKAVQVGEVEHGEVLLPEFVIRWQEAKEEML